MNLITEYFTYTHLVNVIQQTESKGRYAGFSASLSFMLQSLCCHWALGVPVWAVSSAGKRTTPPPPSSPHPPQKKSPKQKSDRCLFREEISPGLRTNCLEKSLQQSDPCLSTAYCRCGVRVFSCCTLQPSCPSWYWGKRKGLGQEVFEKTNPIAASLVSARWKSPPVTWGTPAVPGFFQWSLSVPPHLHLSSSNYGTSSLNLVLQLLQVT